MDRKQLLDILLKCPFGSERKLLKNHKAIIDESFVLILKQEAAKDKNQNNWAKIQYLLGLVFYYHLEESVDNDLQAIAYLRAALKVFSEENFSVEWATVQNYLGNICRNLDGGKSEANIRKAIASYQNALKIRKKDTYPQECADTNYNLGVTYYKLSEVITSQDRTKHLEAAKSCFENVLGLTKPVSESNWAEIKIAIGALFQESQTGKKRENIKYALSCYKEALAVAEDMKRTEAIAFALEYIGHGYRELSQYENTKENVKLAFKAYKTAIIYFKQALKIFTPETNSLECTRIATQLGNLASQINFRTEAIRGYEKAIEAIEVIRDEARTDEHRQKTIREALDVYTRMIEICIESGTKEHLAIALETVERSRSRYLADLMIGQNLSQVDEEVDIPQETKELLEKFANIQQKIDKLRLQYAKKVKSDRDSIGDTFKNIFTNIPEMPIEKARQLEEWEKEKQQIWQKLRKLDPVLAGQLKVETRNIKQLQKLIDSPKTAILSFYSASKHTYIFILRQSSISYHLCPNLSLEALNTWLKQEWFEPYQDTQDNHKKRWTDCMELILQQLAGKLDLDRLVDNSLKDLTELIIVPHQLLHLIPFAALPVTDGGYLSDRFVLRVAPSCQVLAFCQSREQKQPPLTYGTVVHSKEGLYFSKIEENLIAWLYDIPEDCRLREERANKNCYHNLLHQKQIHGLLSSHHAKFDPVNPLDSELILADSKLKLIELLTLKWRTKELNEVFLSCCETNFGIPEPTDDLLTIATGFLCSGARNVISSLWVVDDASTALLSFFYHQARKKGLSRPLALQQAQQRLRNLSDSDLEAAKEDRKQALENKKQARNTSNYPKYKREYDIYLDILDLIEKVLEKKRSQPLSHPFYWAVFTSMGIA